jgi:hypothetical protein
MDGTATRLRKAGSFLSRLFGWWTAVDEEWHQHTTPISKNYRMIDGETVRTRIIMRRSFNGKWEYRLLTGEEEEERFDGMQY